MIKHVLKARYLMAAVFVLAGVSSSAYAQAPAQNRAAAPLTVTLFDPSGPAPDISTVPALRNVVDGGASLHYMGVRSGIHGWLIIKNGQIQMIYLSPDRQTVLVGALMSADGQSVTKEQLQYLAETETRVSQVLSGAGRQEQEIQTAGRPGGAASVPSESVAAGSENAGGIPSVTLSPGERLVQDLKAASGVTLGQHETAKLYMVIAPSCPVCKATWKELKGAVAAGELEVQLVPVYNNPGTEEVGQVAALLLSQDPLESWNKFVDGDKSALAGEADELVTRAIHGNLQIVSKWNIQGYPYLVYRGKDGRIKIVQGRPERMAAVLLDMTR